MNLKNNDLLKKIPVMSFYLAIIMETIMVVVDKSAYTIPYSGRLFQITFCLCVLKICFTKYTLKEWLTMLGFVVLGYISYRATGRNEILRILALIFACKEIDMKRCMKLVFWMTLVGCLILMILALTGVFGTLAVITDFGRGTVETRYALGLGHPNALHCMAWAISLLGIYVYKESVKPWHILTIMVGNVGLYLLTDSRTGMLTFMAILVFILIVLIAQDKNKVSKEATRLLSLKANETTEFQDDKMNFLVYLAAMATMIGAIVFSVLSAIYSIYVRGYHWGFNDCDTIVHKIWGKLDSAINGRIYTLTDTINMEGSITSWTLFSSPEKDYFFDMGWVRMFYWYGIIPASIYVVVLLLLIRQCYKQKDQIAMCMILSVAMYTCIEAHIISIYIGRDYILLLLGMYCCKMISSKVEKERHWWKFWELFH